MSIKNGEPVLICRNRRFSTISEKFERGKLNAEARLVVNFISSLSTRQALASHMAPAAMRELEKISDPWQR
jgi:hypothetical protein